MVNIGVSIDNTVCTFGIGIENLDLADLRRRCPVFEYSVTHFGAAIAHTHSPRSTCLIFASGMGVCVGARTFQEAHLALTILINAMRQCGFKEAHIVKFGTRNVVGSIKLPPIDMHRFCEHSTVNSMYNPSLFPGVRCKPCDKSSKCAIIYASGAVVLTGCSTERECIELAAFIQEATKGYILQCKKLSRFPSAKITTDTLMRCRKRQKRDTDISHTIESGTRVHDDANAAICKDDEDWLDDEQNGVTTTLVQELDGWEDTDFSKSMQPSSMSISKMSASSSGVRALKSYLSSCTLAL